MPLTRRQELQALIQTVIGTNKVYYQAPSNDKMVYPCVIFKRIDANTIFADNRPYNHRKGYQITLISKDPDSSYYDGLANLPGCSFDRTFVADNLYHDVFNIFF